MVFRGILFFQFGLPGWLTWIFSACFLLVIVALIRRWVYYVVTSTSVTMKSGYTQREFASLKLEMIQSINVVQGPIAKFWEIGTLAIQSSNNERELRIRGVKNPEILGAKIRALVPATHNDD